jgi:hypothetical protein
MKLSELRRPIFEASDPSWADNETTRAIGTKLLRLAWPDEPHLRVTDIIDTGWGYRFVIYTQDTQYEKWIEIRIPETDEYFTDAYAHERIGAIGRTETRLGSDWTPYDATDEQKAWVKHRKEESAKLVDQFINTILL